jgi:hypothetical protein
VKIPETDIATMAKNSTYRVRFVTMIHVRLVIFPRPRVKATYSALAALTIEQSVEFVWKKIVIVPSSPL